MRANRASSPSDLRVTITTLVACLLLVNTVLFGFMHAPLAAQANADGTGYIPLLICTANGIQAIRVPADPADPQSAPETSGKYDSYEAYQCALCGIGMHAMAPAEIVEIPVLHRILLSNAVTALHITAHSPQFYPQAGPARAPPVPLAA
ncbi:DUF2946 family protein [Thalassospira mesophila]|uniref:DUF2946 domain-containing protein n=1 Tax=Thalassospira mesophila TaxID=1293891 RepID=A0A1Y2L355_9PROT|nr:DUF2946 family protein [Thalassospira mesophila]OSQ39775.1 hypothetical protein TMES_07465 [Thalassospira mesophila]